MITFEIALLRRRLQGQEKGLCLVQRRLWEAAFLFQELGHSEGSTTSSVIWVPHTSGSSKHLLQEASIVRPPSTPYCYPTCSSTWPKVEYKGHPQSMPAASVWGFFVCAWDGVFCHWKLPFSKEKFCSFPCGGCVAVVFFQIDQVSNPAARNFSYYNRVDIISSLQTRQFIGTVSNSHVLNNLHPKE